MITDLIATSHKRGKIEEERNGCFAHETVEDLDESVAKYNFFNYGGATGFFPWRLRLTLKKYNTPQKVG